MISKFKPVALYTIILLFCAPLVGILFLSACAPEHDKTYFPPSDDEGGWRKIEDTAKIQATTGLDVATLDRAFEIAKASTKNGGLLVVHKGWLVYEDYFGLGHREAFTNLGSVGKSFTSVAAGIIMEEQPDRFPDGLDQQIYHPAYLPASAFPPTDPQKLEIKLGQLLAFSAGIRGNNPVYVNGEEKVIDPPGLDGWSGMVDSYVVGKKDYIQNGRTYTASSLWSEPGGGYSYATASIHLVSMMVRHLSGMEMEEYLRARLAEPLGFSEFTFAYRNIEEVNHTTGGGGVVARPTDMLRFGYLLLSRGTWDGQQIVPAWYVDQCRRTSSYNPHYPYSFQFNVNTGGNNPNAPRDAFWKYGSGGHALFVVPSLDLVIWKLGGRDSQYASDNIGLERHPEAPATAPDREGWTAGIEIEDACIQILNIIIASVRDGG
jgi:CubicO group peptidase (beta-lactamase class C family)